MASRCSRMSSGSSRRARTSWSRWTAAPAGAPRDGRRARRAGRPSWARCASARVRTGSRRRRRAAWSSPASLRSAMISAYGLAGHLGHRLDLGRGEEVRRDAGEPPPRLANEREVVVQRESGVVAALEQHGGGALARGRVHLGHHLLHRERVGLLVAGLAVERAELAVGDADVRVVRVGVDDEGDALLGDAPEPRVLGQAAELERGAPRSGASAPRPGRAACLPPTLSRIWLEHVNSRRRPRCRERRAPPGSCPRPG